MFHLPCGICKPFRICPPSKSLVIIRYPSRTISTRLLTSYKSISKPLNIAKPSYSILSSFISKTDLQNCHVTSTNGRYYATKTKKNAKQATKQKKTAQQAKQQPKTKSKTKPKKKEGPYAKYISKLLMKVHPDLYHRFPEAKEQNSKALQELNSLLETVDEFRNYFEAFHAQNSSKKGILVDIPQSGGPAIPPFPSPHQTLTFIIIKNAGNAADGVLKRLEAVVNLGDLRGIYNKKNLGKFFQVFEQRVGDALYELMTAANIHVPNEDRWDSQSENKWAWDPSQNPNAPKTGRQLLLAELRNTLIDDFSEIITPEAPEEKVDTTLMFFAPEITETEKQQCLTSLKESKEALNNYVGMWEDIPVLITKKSYDATISGFFSFPWDFKAEELAKYLKENLPKVRAEREKIRDELVKASELRTKLVRLLSLDGTFISKKLQSSQVIACLNRLLEISCISKLAGYPLEGLNIYITGDHSYKVQPRGNNGVYIPHDFQVSELCNFLNQVNWKKLKETHVNCKEHQQQVKKLSGSIKHKSNIVHIQFMDTQFDKPEEKNTFSQVTRKDQLDALMEIKNNAQLFNSFPFVEIIIGRSDTMMVDDSLVDQEDPSQRLYKFYIPYRFPFQNVAAFLDAFWLQRKLQIQKKISTEKVSTSKQKTVDSPI